MGYTEMGIRIPQIKTNCINEKQFVKISVTKMIWKQQKD